MTTTTLALFDDPPREAREPLGPGAFVLPGFALPFAGALLVHSRSCPGDHHHSEFLCNNSECCHC